MRRTLFVFMLMAVITGGSARASAQDDWREDRQERRELWRERADRRADWRDIRRDQAAIAHDRWELRRDLFRGDYAGAAHERAELRRRYRDLAGDRWDVRRDNREIYRNYRPMERNWQ